ncbi:MAG: GNAT family N-acetyltransferase [Ekhidna sp.]|nr:GNAT family N-acetyltransferase [Ekhidna sp.]
MEKLTIIERTNEDLPFHLFLLADPSIDLIKKYLIDSNVFLGQLNDQTLGALIMTSQNNEAEIMNVAVDESYQGHGFGSHLIKHAINYCKENAISRLLIGTADTSEDQLRLYQKLGFKKFDVKTDFFLSHYKEPIFENGRQAKDMIMLELLV